MVGRLLKPDTERSLVWLMPVRLGPSRQATLHRLIVLCRLRFWFLRLYLVVWLGGLLDQTSHRPPELGSRFLRYQVGRVFPKELPGDRRLNFPMPRFDRG